MHKINNKWICDCDGCKCFDHCDHSTLVTIVEKQSLNDIPFHVTNLDTNNYKLTRTGSVYKLWCKDGTGGTGVKGVYAVRPTTSLNHQIVIRQFNNPLKCLKHGSASRKCDEVVHLANTLDIDLCCTNTESINPFEELVEAISTENEKKKYPKPFVPDPIPLPRANGIRCEMYDKQDDTTKKMYTDYDDCKFDFSRYYRPFM